MYSKHKTASLALLTMLALAVFFAGCTTGPVPDRVNPPLHEQERVQAADHWRNIAEDTAAGVTRALAERKDLLVRPVYVQPPNGRPFHTAFYNLLKTELVSRGIQVSEFAEPDTSRLSYNVQTLVYDKSRAGSWRAGRQEIVITTRLEHDNRYAMHKSYPLYINDADWPLYIDPQSTEPDATTHRTVRVVRKR